MNSHFLRHELDCLTVHTRWVV